MMPNKTYELRNLYFQQSQYSVEPVEPDKPLFLQWPSNGYFERLQPDADLLQKALNPETDYKDKTVSEQIFGNEIKQQYISLKHMANLFYERCKLNKQHIQDIDHRHIEIQEKKSALKSTTPLTILSVFPTWKANCYSSSNQEEKKNLHSGRIL